jgi:hypothetical protein
VDSESQLKSIVVPTVSASVACRLKVRLVKGHLSD